MNLECQYIQWRKKIDFIHSKGWLILLCCNCFINREKIKTLKSFTCTLFEEKFNFSSTSRFFLNLIGNFYKRKKRRKEKGGRRRNFQFYRKNLDRRASLEQNLASILSLDYFKREELFRTRFCDNYSIKKKRRNNTFVYLKKTFPNRNSKRHPIVQVKDPCCVHRRVNNDP